MKEEKVKQIIKELMKRAKEAKRKCCLGACNETAIASHLLQRNGILSQITDESSKVYEIGIDIFKPETFYFKLTGIKDAFSFPGFCNKHDTELFKEIESTENDFNNYRTQLLFSYRVLMNEKRKKEVNIDGYNRILFSNELIHHVNKNNIQKMKEGELLALEEASYYEKIFLSNLENKELRDFAFLTFYLPRIDLVSSAVFSYETTAEIARLDKKNKNKPLTDIYFNFLPAKDKSVIIFGVLNERVNKCWDYIASFNTGDSKSALKKISDLLLCQVENWLCSPNLYEQHLKNKKEDIIRISNESGEHPDERRSLIFNMFDTLELEYQP